ncbi:MAG: endo-1,4-beta-xylanase [bacterium]
MKRWNEILKLFLAVVFSQTMFGSSLLAQPFLKDVFKDYYYIGTALNHNHVFSRDSLSMELVKKQFNSITPENLLKWEPVHPKVDQYNFEPADSFVAFGQRNNMFIIGHTLVWHAQTPRWVFEDEAGNPATREVLLQRMRDHIYSVAGRYKGRINGWDVVNEAFEDDGALRKSKWFQIIGEDYIEKAFEYAHEADPDAELYYNDYNEWHIGKVNAVVNLVKNLQSKGIKIHGIGMQGHWGMDYPTLNELDEALKKYSETGLKIVITELDISILPNPWNYTGAEISQNFELQKKLNPYPDSLPDSMQVKLSERYSELFRTINKYKDSVSRITFWGVHDGGSWKNNFPVRGRTDYPLLFDRNLQPKPVFYGVIKTITE